MYCEVRVEHASRARSLLVQPTLRAFRIAEHDNKAARSLQQARSSAMILWDMSEDLRQTVGVSKSVQLAAALSHDGEV
jgi:hypothetical protein